MAFKVPDEGEKRMLALVVADAANWRVRLFSTDVTPANNDTVASYTQATFSGYAEVTPAGWTAPATNVDGEAASTANLIPFVHNGGAVTNEIFGYYVVQTGAAESLLWAERFDTSVDMVNLGSTINLTPRLTLRSRD